MTTPKPKFQTSSAHGAPDRVNPVTGGETSLQVTSASPAAQSSEVASPVEVKADPMIGIEAWQRNIPQGRLMDVPGYDGRVFTARVVVPGEQYGLRGCLVWGKDENSKTEGKQDYGIEFYDKTYQEQVARPLGQFVSRYYWQTLADKAWDRDLNLQAGEPAWTLPGDSLRRVQAFAMGVIDNHELSLNQDFRNEIEGEVQEGVARAFFVSEWAQAMEERGHRFGRVDVAQEAPEPPEEAYAAAERFLADLAKASGLADAFAIAEKVAAGDRLNVDFARDLGWYLGLEGQGHGVSWADDHAPHGLTVPNVEFYVDIMDTLPEVDGYDWFFAWAESDHNMIQERQWLARKIFPAFMDEVVRTTPVREFFLLDEPGGEDGEPFFVQAARLENGDTVHAMDKGKWDSLFQGVLEDPRFPGVKELLEAGFVEAKPAADWTLAHGSSERPWDMRFHFPIRLKSGEEVYSPAFEPPR